MHEHLHRRRDSSTCSQLGKRQKRPSMVKPKSSHSSPADSQFCFQFQPCGHMEQQNPQCSQNGRLAAGSKSTDNHHESQHSNTNDDITAAVQLNRRVFSFWEEKGPTARRVFEEGLLSPPITATSLKELELSCIMNNARLRHDINFDRELHFRPNLDGSRGKEKLLLTDRYWDAVATELKLFVFLLTDDDLLSIRWNQKWKECFRQAQRRIPLLFHTIRDILTRLMPDEEQDILSEAFDVPFLLQQIEHGVFDLAKLSRWLGGILKAHCAPMRDNMVDETVNMIAQGAEAFDTSDTVQGLRSLSVLLEAMKLDVANHQIRYMRPTLLENTITFEQTYFVSKIEAGQINLASALKWYQPRDTPFLDVFEAHYASQHRQSEPSTPMKSFITTLVYAVVPPPLEQAVPLPDTFRLDIDRLRTVVHDTTNLVFSAICHDLLAVLLNYEQICESDAERARASLNSFLLSGVIAHAGEGKWFTKINNIAIEMARIIDRCTGCKLDSKSEPQTEISEVIRARYDYSVSYLDANFRRTSPVFAQKSFQIRHEILNRVVECADAHYSQSAFAVFEALAPPKRSKFTPPYEPHHLLDEVSQRLAHICILHWHVWSPVVCPQMPTEQQQPPLGAPLPASRPFLTESTGRIVQAALQEIAHSNSMRQMGAADPTQTMSSPRQPPSSS